MGQKELSQLAHINRHKRLLKCKKFRLFKRHFTNMMIYGLTADDKENFVVMYLYFYHRNYILANRNELYHRIIKIALVFKYKNK